MYYWKAGFWHEAITVDDDLAEKEPRESSRRRSSLLTLLGLGRHDVMDRSNPRLWLTPFPTLTCRGLVAL